MQTFKIIRDVPVKKLPKPTETERQGPGRAYWFETAKDAAQFAREKRRRGYYALVDSYEGDHYVWICKLTNKRAVDAAERGIDPIAIAEWLS
jgi:hypothetical protein